MDKKEYQRIFSHNLIRYMSLNNKTQTDLINDLGFNKSAVSTWVNGTRMPRMDKVNMLAEYFGILRSDLIEDKTDLSTTPSVPQLRPDEDELLNNYNNLNDKGKAKLKNYIDDLMSNPVNTEAAQKKEA